MQKAVDPGRIRGGCEGNGRKLGWLTVFLGNFESSRRRRRTVNHLPEPASISKHCSRRQQKRSLTTFPFPLLLLLTTTISVRCAVGILGKKEVWRELIHFANVASVLNIPSFRQIPHRMKSHAGENVAAPVPAPARPGMGWNVSFRTFTFFSPVPSFHLSS